MLNIVAEDFCCACCYSKAVSAGDGEEAFPRGSPG